MLFPYDSFPVRSVEIDSAVFDSVSKSAFLGYLIKRVRHGYASVFECKRVEFKGDAVLNLIGVIRRIGIYQADANFIWIDGRGSLNEEIQYIDCVGLPKFDGRNNDGLHFPLDIRVCLAIGGERGE